MSEDEEANLGFLEKGREYDSYNHPVFINRRVDFDIIKYYEEFYKLPRYIITHHKDRGSVVKEICKECFAKTMYDSDAKEFYCPFCNDETHEYHG